MKPFASPGPSGAGGSIGASYSGRDTPATDHNGRKIRPLSIPSRFYKGITVPLKIKFSGVYWFFRWPNRGGRRTPPLCLAGR
jgi:hypothetical protein